MKKFKVKFLTQSGVIEQTISEGEDLDKLAKKIQLKYGTFITLSSEEL
jgi:hypothetical protein